MSFVTTVMPVYNGEKLLGQALDSLARQTRRPDRLVILDDCSTDGTRRIVEQFTAFPCEYRRNPQNLGNIGNHDQCMSFAADTDLLHLFHQDDMLKPHFLERMVPLAESIPGRALVFATAEGIYLDGRRIPPAVPHVPGPPTEVTVDEFLDRRLRFRPDMYVGACLFKTDRQPAPCHWPAHMKNVGDQVFYARWATHCARLLEVHEELIYYRVHEHNAFKMNLLKMDSLILEDWEALQLIEALRPRRGFMRWLRQQKLWCFYAALTHSKLSLIQQQPAYAAEVRREMRRRIHPLHWLLGKTAFNLREAIRKLRR